MKIVYYALIIRDMECNERVSEISQTPAEWRFWHDTKVYYDMDAMYVEISKSMYYRVKNAFDKKNSKIAVFEDKVIVRNPNLREKAEIERDRQIEKEMLLT